MSLQEKIMADLKDAMRAKDEVAKETLRMLKTELGRKELELGHALSDSDEIAVLSRALKTRKESAEQYAEGGRDDLAQKERDEMAIVERYLPKTMSEEEARTAIADIVSATGASSKKDMGSVMKEVRAKYAGQIDGKLASKIVSGLLS